MHTIIANRDNISKCMYVAVLLLLMYSHQFHNYVWWNIIHYIMAYSFSKRVTGICVHIYGGREGP